MAATWREAQAAVDRHDVEWLRAALARGLDVPLERLLESAVLNKSTDCAEFLFAAGAEVTEDVAAYLYDEALVLVSFSSELDAERLRVALACGLDVRRVPEGAPGLLEGAVLHGWTDGVKLLLAAGAEVNEVGLGGATPLHLACLPDKDRDTIAFLLLAAGADSNLISSSNSWSLSPPSHFALIHGKRKVLLQMLRSGANVEVLPATSAHLNYSPRVNPEKLLRVKDLNDYMIRIRDSGGWNAHVVRHRALLVGRLRNLLRLPEDPLGVVVDFSILPGGG